MSKLIILTSRQVLFDNRLGKYLRFLDGKKIDYHVIGWDRDNIGLERNNTEFFRRKSGYAVGGLKAMYNRLFWFQFIVKKLKRFNKTPLFIHACNLDAAFPVAIYKKFFNKQGYLLFDVGDWMSSVIQTGNKVLLFLIKSMERFCLKQADKVIICEKERREQLPQNYKKEVLVLPNVPMIDDIDSVCVEVDNYKFNNDKITLSYVGWFGKGRFLEELLEYTKQKKCNLLIAGYGNKEIEEKCIELSSQENVKYFGRVAHKEGMIIMYNSDLIYAMYCKISNNHIYAAPNKLYEAMCLGKPLLTTKGIIIGKKVEEENIGYTINETKESLNELIQSLKINDLLTKGNNAKNMWNNKYNDYTINFLNKEYLSLLKKCKIV